MKGPKGGETGAKRGIEVPFGDPAGVTEQWAKGQTEKRRDVAGYG